MFFIINTCLNFERVMDYVSSNELMCVLHNLNESLFLLDGAFCQFQILTSWVFLQMALQTATNPTTPSAQVVGNAFVEQYYHILHHSPELVYRFYQDSSVISRPDSNGVMTSVSTMKVSFLRQS